MKTGNASGAALSPGGGGWDGGERNEDGVRHRPCCWGSCMGTAPASTGTNPDYTTAGRQRPG